MNSPVSGERDRGAIGTGSSQVSMHFRSESGTYEDWSTEENLVKTTVATGNRPLLTNAQISEFIKSCQMCNCDKVLELLSQSLHSAEGDTLMVTNKQTLVQYV